MSTVEINPFLAHFENQKQRSMQLRSEHVTHRLQRLKKVEKWIHKHRLDIQEALFQDFKKSPEEVDITEIYPVLSELRKVRRELRHWARPKKIANPMTYWGTQSEVYYEPKGTTLIISPWNYPFQLSLGPLVSAIAAGNTMTLKPSEYTPHTSKLLCVMAEELFEDNVLSVVEGDYKVSGRLLELPFDHIFFTGSPKVGKIVMAAAAKNLTSVTLELGGKSPAIVDETAQVADAASKIAWGKWLNAGQTCVAPDYVLCHESKMDEFVKSLKASTTKLYGNQEKFTGIVSDQHLSRLTKAINTDLNNGAELLFGNEVTEGKLHPTALGNLPQGSLFLEEEVFGPVMPIISYQSFDEVIKLINDRPKPLAMYHFSKSSQAMKKVKQRVSSGTMCFNDCVIQFVHPSLPIGGVNNSGIGKAHGYAGFVAFSNEKAVVKQRRGLTMAKTLYPPFGAFKKLTLELMLKYF